jgi:hypothetical protein
MSVVIKRADAMMRAGKYADGSRIEPVRKEVQAEDPMLLLVKSIQGMIAQIPVLLDKQNAQHTQAIADMMSHMAVAMKPTSEAQPIAVDKVGEEWETIDMEVIRDSSGKMARAIFKRMK